MQSASRSPIAIYAGAYKLPLPTEWTKFSGVIQGIADKQSLDKWWPGTKYVKVFIGRRPNEPYFKELYFDDISLKEIKK